MHESWPCCFEAIFVSYEEARIGWIVRDLKGAIHFLRDVIFNEDLSGRLGIVRTPSSIPSTTDLTTKSPRPACERILTAAGHASDEVLHLKEARGLKCMKRKLPMDENILQDGGGEITANGGAVLCAIGDGNVPESVAEQNDVVVDIVDGDILSTGTSDLTPSEEVFSDLLSFLAPRPLSFPDQIDTKIS